jgi:superfamily I DNA/RNA helicase
VAGPGTGKTFTFGAALASAGGRGLALTFIRLLVEGMTPALAPHADARTFHGFCFELLRSWSGTGLSRGFRFYPSLLTLYAKDLAVLGYVPPSEQDIERNLHLLADPDFNDEVLSLGTYYDAATFTDMVYRVLKHLSSRNDRIPRYSLVVVDEYQDFTRLETSLIEILGGENPLLIAGDDDQALYRFRHASPEYIRALAADKRFGRLDLPYCGRSTFAIVGGVNLVIARAMTIGLLGARIDKPYLPVASKQDDSDRYPVIADVRCSVQTARSPFMSRYIADRIAEIPAEEIDESIRENFPTVLILGRREFLGQIHKQLKENGFPQIQYRKRRTYRVRVLDGYRILADDEVSNLGWRIVVDAFPPDDLDLRLERALTNRTQLSLELDPAFVAVHLDRARAVGDLVDGQPVAAARMRDLREACRLTKRQIEEALRTSPFQIDLPLASDDAGSPDDGAEDAASTSPTIVCASLVGSKGLSAQHVFVVGMNNGFLPIDPDGITEDEVCQLIVGISRTRKKCYLLSAGRSAMGEHSPSVFLGWLAGLTERERATAQSWDRPWSSESV